jgi:phosphomannomutase / phosphoglucomutase
MIPDISLFRAYDIRGRSAILTPGAVSAIGRAMAEAMLNLGHSLVALGYDGRLSSPQLVAAMRTALLEGGISVVEIGCQPTPLLYFAALHHCHGNGIMITGSHNPPEYNGIKWMVAGTTRHGRDLGALYTRILAAAWPTVAAGHAMQRRVDADYLAAIGARISLQRPLKVVIDCCHGAAAEIAPRLYRQLGVDLVALNATIDGHFPSHLPNPSDPQNLQQLIATVIASRADIGLAFDGDGDRLVAIDNHGAIVWPDRLLLLFADDLLQRQPNATILYDVKCSHTLAPQIRAMGGQPIMGCSGHSLLKAQLIAIDAPLAGEFSGHFFFRDGWYGFDDGLYAGARLLEILARQPQSLAERMAQWPQGVSTPELQIPLEGYDPQPLMARLIDLAQQRLTTAQLTTMDGLRIDYSDRWGLIRPSNTTPVLTLRFEGDSDAALCQIVNQLLHLFHEVAPMLSLPPNLIEIPCHDHLPR